MYLLLLVFPASMLPGVSEAKGGRVIIDSSHKFVPDNVNAPEQNLPGYNGTVSVIRNGDAKQKPERRTYRRDAASEDQLQRRISSRSAILMNGANGEVIYEQLPDMPAQPASTIKILTGLIAIQSLNDKEYVSVSRRAAGMPRSKVYLEKGKSYHASDLINAVLLSSANDASVALAEKVAGSENVFSKLMTHKARAWGATNTQCKTATGLTAKGQQSTARDLAILMNRAMENDEFAERMAQSRVRTGFGKVLRNHNKALWEISGAEGGKTGYTRAARQTYVGKFKRGDDELLLAILGSETMWDDIRNLVEYGFDVLATEEETSAAKGGYGVGAPDILLPVDFKASFVLQVLSDAKKASVL